MKAINTLALFSLIFIMSCGTSSYNTNFENPDIKANPEDVFPENILKMPRTITVMKMHSEDYGGVKAEYGDKEITIEVVVATSQDMANRYTKAKVIPRLEAYNENTIADSADKWLGKGTKDTGETIVALQNGLWIYLISASDSEKLTATVKEFKYISEK